MRHGRQAPHTLVVYTPPVYLDEVMPIPTPRQPIGTVPVETVQIPLALAKLTLKPQVVCLHVVEEAFRIPKIAPSLSARIAELLRTAIIVLMGLPPLAATSLVETRMTARLGCVLRSAVRATTLPLLHILPLP